MKKLFLIFALFSCLTLNMKAYSSEEETLIIFDASVSMINNFDGRPKYISAIEETKNILDKIPDTKKIGLRTIGVTIDGALAAFIQNPDELCKATKLVNPIKEYNINSVKNSLDSIFPLGTTPLAYTLNMAINYDFSDSKSTLKHIILVTDGAESCNGDPCKFITEIMRSRRDIIIDIIAIGVNAQDFKQLKCLADNTSGNIINVSTPDELKNAFNKFFLPEISNNINKNYNNYEAAKNIIYKNYLIKTDY